MTKIINIEQKTKQKKDWKYEANLKYKLAIAYTNTKLTQLCCPVYLF